VSVWRIVQARAYWRKAGEASLAQLDRAESSAVANAAASRGTPKWFAPYCDRARIRSTDGRVAMN